MPEKTTKSLLSGREYIGVDKIDGPLVFVSKTHPVGYRELVECVDKQGHVRLGIVLESSTNAVVVQVFEGTSGLTLPGTRVRFSGEPLRAGCLMDWGIPLTEGRLSEAISSWMSTEWR